MAKRLADAAQNEPAMLVFQGGGALGAYQGGVYEALHAAGYRPDWLAGMSIGAINSALIAGNEPERRVERLRNFWELVSSQLILRSPLADGPVRKLFNESAAGLVSLAGIPGFFAPRVPPPFAHAPGSEDAVSFYDTSPLRKTLLELVDFELLNSGRVRFSVGAVNVQTGNFAYFDNRECEIRPEHIMASGALPPGFPPVVIEGTPYWDGGLVSNTPLQYVLDNRDPGDATIFQVDLFSARGKAPRTIGDVLQREKDIRYSSRTRFNTDVYKRLGQLHEAAERLRAKLPPELREDEDMRLLASCYGQGAITLVHLINRSESFETQSKDYEFSRMTIDEHWASGKADVERTFSHPEWSGRKRHVGGIVTYDLAETGVEPPNRDKRAGRSPRREGAEA